MIYIYKKTRENFGKKERSPFGIINNIKKIHTSIKYIENKLSANSTNFCNDDDDDDEDFSYFFL